MPHTAEIDRFILALQNRGDFGKPVQPIEERIDVRLADRLCQLKLPVRRQVLPAKDDHVIVQPDGPDFIYHARIEACVAKNEPGDFSPHGRRQRRYLHVVTPEIIA